jgi:U3 small nucleolar ribonucleoprotein protein IMP4
MLITTSRKPSPRTRSFARSLERVLNSKYLNRGKMSMRDVLLKLRASDRQSAAVISEMKGNPSRIEFFNLEGDLILNMDITVTNSLGKGRIKKKELKLRWDLDESNLKDESEIKGNMDLKEKIISSIGVPEDPVELIKTNTLKDELRPYSNSNLILVKGEEGKAVMEFHDQEGQITGPRIYIHKCRTGD